MQEPRATHDTESVRHLQLRRRAKRGIVASYIHQVSARHKGDVDTESLAEGGRRQQPGSPVYTQPITERETKEALA
jgi:hypothetical protein